jgi:membrane-associated phospholipid phosphatase
MGICAAVVGTVAYSRMYLDAHFLSDILGGFTAGLAYLGTALWAIRSAPPLAHVLRIVPLARGADSLLTPAMAGSSLDSLVAATSAVAMSSATPVSDTP